MCDGEREWWRVGGERMMEGGRGREGEGGRERREKEGGGERGKGEGVVGSEGGERGD